ncbi:MAG: hypothetical protein AB8B79_00425 [Granulosicoccus sp.]
MIQESTITKLIASGILVLSLVACSDDNEDTPVQPNGNSALNGTWSAGCVVDGDGDGEVDTFTISGDTFQVRNETFFNDASCANARTVEINTSGTFLIGADVPLATGAAASQVNINYQSASVTYFGTNIINNANSNQVCGINNWVDGVSQDATVCLELPAISYDVFRLDGNTLYFGDDSGDGETPQTRPTGLDLDNPLTRR